MLLLCACGYGVNSCTSEMQLSRDLDQYQVVYIALRICTVVAVQFPLDRCADSVRVPRDPCDNLHHLSMLLSQPQRLAPPPAFAQLVKAEQDDVRHRNTHFTCCTLACEPSSSIILGTTLGDICVVDSNAPSQGHQSFATAVSSSVLGHRGGVNAVCSIGNSDSSSNIITCGSDGDLKMWKVTGSSSNQALQHASTLQLSDGFRAADSSAQSSSEALCMVTDGSSVLAGTNCGEIVHFDLQKGVSVQERFPAHAGAVLNISQNTVEGSVLASASDDGSVALWDLRSSLNSCITRFRPSSHQDSSTVGCQSLDGRSRPSMGSVPAWGGMLGESKFIDHKQPAPGGPVCCSFDTSGSWVAVGCTDAKLRYWSIRMQKITSTLSLDGVPLSMTTHGRDLWVGCSKGSLYAGGFLASSVDAFQRLVVPGRPAVLGLVGMHHDLALAGTVYACCAPGTIHAVNTLGRNSMGTITTCK